MNVLMRSYTSGRTGANTEETVLTPARVGSNLLVKRLTIKLNDDPRLEAQPLFVSGVSIAKGPPRDVVYVCTMANNVWAFDAASGNEVWPNPVNLGRPIVPIPNANGGTEIELFHINVHWGTEHAGDRPRYADDVHRLLDQQPRRIGRQCAVSS